MSKTKKKATKSKAAKPTTKAANVDVAKVMPTLVLRDIPQAGGRRREPWSTKTVRSAVYVLMASSINSGLGEINRATVIGGLETMAKTDDHLKKMIGDSQSREFKEAVSRARSSFLREYRKADEMITKVPGYNAECLINMQWDDDK